MKIRNLFLLFSFFLFISAKAQNTFKAVVKDSITKEILPGVAVWIQGGKLHGKTTEKGIVTIRKVPDGQQNIFFYLKGYRRINIMYDFPLADNKAIEIELSSLGMYSDEVFVTSFRTKTRVENTITPTTVIAGQQLELESTITPGSTSNLFNHQPFITVQRTNQINGNDVLRMQGLDGKYTQVLHDGMPLYSGYAASIGLLATPPLDLKQVEIINGASFALYGDGAIGGIVNFISKTPSDYPEATITVNATSLDEGNINGFTSGHKGKLGYTVFGGVNVKQSIDINKDGFAEVPRDKNYTIHPRLFYNVTPKTQVIIGLSSSYNQRAGGEIQAVDYGVSDPYPFLHNETIYRNTLDFTFINKHSQKHTLTVKAAGSAFERDVNYSGFTFDATQYTSYTEINDLIKLKKHTIVTGINFKSENFVLVNSGAKNFGNYDYYTAGGLIQDDWQVNKKVSVQLGMRYDYHFTFHSFFLPRVAFMYKPKPKLTFRLAGGTGYKTPNMFDLTEPSAYINPVSSDIKSENSYGANADIIYHTIFTKELDMTIAPSMFYTNSINPVVLITDTTHNQFAGNGNYTTSNYGANLYLHFKYKAVQLSLGYTHTEAVQKVDTLQFNMPFNPKDKLYSMLIYSIEDRWRIGVSADYIANQYLYNNDLVSDYWMLGAMVEWKFQYGSLVLNCKNVLDNRQSKYETIVEGNRQSPVFKPVWNSLDGRVINFSIRIVI